MKRIVFTFEPLADQTHIEDLFHMRTTGQFSIFVKHRRQLHRTLQAIEPVMAKHFPDRIATTGVEGTE